MIRLSKDKYLYNYTIDENGTIRDDEGVIQNTYLVSGRPTFKHVAVHKIQMYTNNEFRDGHKWAIHHIDENKQNNSLSNLAYLTRSEHTVLHNKNRNYSENTLYKMSKARKGKYKGENHPLYGKHHSEETKRKISEANKGKQSTLGKHWTNETKQKISEAIKAYWANKNK